MQPRTTDRRHCTDLLLLSVTLLVSSWDFPATEAADAETFTSSNLPLQPNSCASFTAGIGYMRGYYQFTTPNYGTGSYPSSSDCIKVIKADNPDHVISLDFRGEFHLEESSRCVSDYLEIRDGPYGYSPLLSNQHGVGSNGRFCGARPPGIQLTSSGQYLWLRFKTDEIIQHAGFKAVYQFHRQARQTIGPKRECLMELQLPVGREEVVVTRQLRARFPQNYIAEPTTPVDCSIDVTSPEGTQILVALETLQVRRDDLCKQQALYFYDGFTVDLQRDFTLCRTLEPKTWTHATAARRAVIHVTSKDTYLIPKFLVAFTVIRKGNCQPGTEFDCSTDRCIDSRLVCNHHVNCPDGRDEANCLMVATHSHEAADADEKKAESEKSAIEKKPPQVPYHPIVLGSIGVLFLALTVACCCVTLRQRLRERNRRNSEAAHTEAAAQDENHELSLIPPQSLPPLTQQLQTLLPPPQLSSDLSISSNNGGASSLQNGFAHFSDSQVVDPAKFMDPRGPPSPLVSVFTADSSAARAARLSSLQRPASQQHQQPQQAQQQQAPRKIRLVFQA